MCFSWHQKCPLCGNMCPHPTISSQPGWGQDLSKRLCACLAEAGNQAGFWVQAPQTDGGPWRGTSPTLPGGVGASVLQGPQEGLGAAMGHTVASPGLCSAPCGRGACGHTRKSRCQARGWTSTTQTNSGSSHHLLEKGEDGPQARAAGQRCPSRQGWPES